MTIDQLQLSRTRMELIASKEAAIQRKSIATPASCSSIDNVIPNLFHTLDCSLTFDEVVDWLGKSEKVMNLIMFFEGIWTWMCTNNNFNIECTTQLLQRFYEIKERRKWEVIYTAWITYRRPGNEESKFFVKIRCDRRLSLRLHDKEKWTWPYSKQDCRNIDSVFDVDHKRTLKFQYEPLNAGGCNKPGKCGFIIKTVLTEDGANMILCTDPSEYSEEIHYHEEYKAKDLYFSTSHWGSFNHYHIPLSWNGVPVIKSGKVYWGELLAEYTEPINWQPRLIVQMKH